MNSEKYQKCLEDREKILRVGYKKYIDTIMSTAIYSLGLDKYSKSNLGGNKVFNVYDKSGNQYIIKEISIMNYEIYLDSHTVSIS